MDELSEAEIEARIRSGRRVSGLVAGVSLFLFSIPVAFVVGLCLFLSHSMSSMD